MRRVAIAWVRLELGIGIVCLAIGLLTAVRASTIVIIADPGPHPGAVVAWLAVLGIAIGLVLMLAIAHRAGLLREALDLD